MTDFDALIAKLPSMSRRQEKQLKQEWRKQFKPESVARKDQARNFFTVVGLAITRWARMEERLVQIVSKLLEIPEAKTGLIMYSILNFNVWLDIIESLFVLDGTYPRSLKKWHKIYESLREIKDTRDRLAHHALIQIEEKDALTGEKGIRAYSHPPKLDTRNKAKKMAPLSMMEILHFADKVDDIRDRLISLLAQMKKPSSLR